MKYIKYALIAMIIAFIGFFIYSEQFSDPLGDGDANILFPNIDIHLKMIHHKDFAGFGKDFFDIYVYKAYNASIENAYPQFGYEWSYARIDSTAATSTWLRCPVDSATLVKYEFELDAIIRNDYGKYKFLRGLLMNERNYYSYVFIDSHEKYFFLYESEKNYLYYIRQRGF
ncbi:MAG: hypothetical protein LBN29_08510 [Mediterranea sp.]|jgi:hypothetical protein|nr:hypothetical protein [Mediterranea sp.]